MWPITVDIGEFEIALVNLVINSRDAMTDGGTVTIIARRTSLVGESESIAAGEYVAHRRQRHRRRHPAGRHRQRVRPVLHHEAGRQGHRPWTVAGARLRASGRRHREDRPARSATAPPSRSICRARQASCADTMPSEASNAPARTGTVLLVEDNPEVASASASLLEQLGYSVRWVPNAEAALEEIERNGIDLVFSDIVMPGRMDGLGLARAHQGKAAGAADPARHRLQRGRAERPRRFPDPAQALSDARAQPRARGDPAGRSLKRASRATKKPGATAGLSSVESKNRRQAKPSATSRANLSHLEIFRRFLAAICDDFVLNVLTFVERAQSGALDGGDVNEHILATALRLDKAITLGRVEPLHSACSHYQSPSLQKNKSSDDPPNTRVSG